MGALPAAAVDHRTVIDIEALLVWAVQRQCCDRTDIALHPMERSASLALQHGRHIGVIAEGRSADGVATILDRNDIGADIDGGGAIRGIPPRLHPDAERVGEALERLPAAQRRLVARHARLGGRPEWASLRQPMVAAKRPSDAPGRYRHLTCAEWEQTPRRSDIAALYHRTGRSLFLPDGRKRLPEEEKGFSFRVGGDGQRWLLVKWCPLEPRLSEAEVAEINHLYSLWRDGVLTLYVRLTRLELRDHILRPFSIPGAPWDQNP
ncbi:hypothetical protein TSH100_04050 [Azospirillum sp. TSH100]|uniref:hypothetical protein n=1 Tax=Azospirillum sp. TSH100 TaxID=652764 RepID=UPI000D60DD3E|nr:hypothetical protein [Azospirillum sp. TSH100]PWC89819.1 hypothetical protein TSH100_04050 [Azospirillum sp. TSH100]QCG92358.1 hypothetical protein E6C72_31640 [Azospirillum sp. TSH100]